MDTAFSILEWAECPTCGFPSDAPFRVPGSKVVGTELVLGDGLPEGSVPEEKSWRTFVSAECPKCQNQIRAEAVFCGRVLTAFHPEKESNQPPETRPTSRPVSA